MMQPRLRRGVIEMNVLIKSGAMCALVALFLGVLGFYDNLSRVGAAEDQKTQKVAVADSKTTGDLLAPSKKSDDNIAERVALIDRIAKSEARIKIDVEKLEVLPNGLTLYSFKYRTDPTRYVGLMANDLASSEEFSKFVVDMGEGYYTINYPALKIHQATYDDYKRLGLAALDDKPNLASSKAPAPTN